MRTQGLAKFNQELRIVDFQPRRSDFRPGTDQAVKNRDNLFRFNRSLKSVFLNLRLAFRRKGIVCCNAPEIIAQEAEMFSRWRLVR
jgi:hypothetical protein